ncbi:FMN-binding negative transcriptional regulator [Tardiphaga alba]|uniref:FMN-binding negative transcriptional regulator n=1 Tax=Tardiphaga alba TaxID=340268 RepID=A0ABX8A8S7_9BRAD|nr:FMN-binding negative transcriptional regulator [Tardiphaga alba]QUS39872.1 FMN-binding negative transcriptional regulator [Tardiphaga alba]
MYTPPRFQTDRSDALAFADARGFGTVCAFDGRKPIASAVPFYLEYGNDGTPHLAFHLARQNPLLKHADGVTSWTMAVLGADAYVSPDWYVSPDQVGTWLYQAVHLTGPVRLLPERELGAHLDALSARFESWLAPKPPWTSAKMARGRLEAMRKAIVGVVMAVDEVEGSFKLNQHKSDADHLAVMSALAMRPEPDAIEISDAMRKLRPHLFAEETSHLAAMAEAEGFMG